MDIYVALIDHLKLICTSYPLMLEQTELFKSISIEGTIAGVKDFMNHTDNIPHAFLIDIQLLKNNSISIVSFLHENYPSISLIAISDTLRYVKIKAMMDSGCVAFFGMGIEPNLLFKGIRDVISGNFKSKEHDFIDRASFVDLKFYNGYPVLHFDAFELDIIDYLCSNLSMNQIALKLGVNYSKVNHWERIIFEKFDVHDRTSLIYLCIHYGYIDADVMRDYSANNNRH